ncbi:ABC-type glycerol-3-phosphate transport system permease component [Paenibacillus phyllosphaerae]|uniref:ABC-type glycerol-3-phosphate transport system permease component n=1 Tax=Paenibacillus phyllosphaerae TaxID=274593 RepID=A0A7W5B2Q1_9BACL|nr:carbohydrate ABC transporter permease [Paenibacillus phyllosphaerae]MBB3113347.1 ABC-type glycerol-3-phosphate transport system permease component [Paenibacillus phyllosphaerae]
MSKESRERSIMSDTDFRKPQVKIGYGVMLLALAALALTMLYPFGTTIFSSLKTRQEVFTYPPSFFPKQLMFENYMEGFRYIDLGRAFANTALLYAGNVLIPLTVIGLAAFSMSQMKLPFRRALTMFFMSTLMIPSATYLIPSFLNLQNLGLIDSYWAFWLAGGANAFSIMLVKSFFDGIHKELFEAARIDGASELRCFFQLALPLSKPVFATLMILTFTNTWNDWYWPSLVISTPEKLPIAPLVYKNIISSMNMPMNIKFSVLTIIMAPPLLFFAIFQKNIVHGLNLSGVKG